jgi:hypothetical protein
MLLIIWWWNLLGDKIPFMPLRVMLFLIQLDQIQLLIQLNKSNNWHYTLG